MTETTRSGFHRFVEASLGPNYLWQDYVSECTDFPPYQLDIYLPEWHACVEVDGPYHFSKKDEERDRVMLEQYQVLTLRIPTKTGLRRAEVTKLLTDFIELAATTAEQRKHAWHNT